MKDVAVFSHLRVPFFLTLKAKGGLSAPLKRTCDDEENIRGRLFGKKKKKIKGSQSAVNQNPYIYKQHVHVTYNNFPPKICN